MYLFFLFKFSVCCLKLDNHLILFIKKILANARIVYERAIEFFGDDNMDEKLYIAFAKFEENQREVCSIPFSMIFLQISYLQVIL